MMILRWLLSKTVREAVAMRKHVHRLLCAQRDLMAPPAVQSVNTALVDLQGAIAVGVGKKDLRKQMEKLEQVANKWLKPYPHPAWRENVEVLLVAIAVAMGIRTFFLQPFKIPTGSMQPTLYGVTSVPDYTRAFIEARGYDVNKDEMSDTAKAQFQARIHADVNKQAKAQADLKIPTGWERLRQWLHGDSYVHFVAPEDGSVEAVTKPWPGTIFNLYQHIKFGGKWYTIWFPPDYGGEFPLEVRAGLTPERVYHKGEDVVKMEVHAGDHLFVDRFTYNFRKPRRGEIVVFETRGIPESERERWHIPANEFYIKRLVGLGGETISLHQDYEVTDVPQPDGTIATVPVGNLVVDGKPLSAATPRFANLYAFADAPVGAKVLHYQDNHYYGHAMIRNLAPGDKYKIQPDDLFVMGDNTMNSLDSRFWGDFPARYVIGKSFFVYWPLSKRFGIGQSISVR